MATSDPARRGRNAMPLALRTRNCIWAWLVLILTPQVVSWGGLDAHWLPGIDCDKETGKPIYDARGRRRVFENCFRYGTDPTCVTGLNGTKLLAVLHAAPELRIAKQFFESELWDLLCQSTPQPAQEDACMTRQRAHSGPGHLARLERAAEGVIAHAWPAEVHRHVFLKDAGTVDGLLVLGCHHARASASGSDRAHIARRTAALGFALQRFVERWHIPERLSDALAHLIQTRLIEGHARQPVPQELAALGFPVRQRKPVERVSPPKKCAGLAQSRARLQAGFIATCVRLAIAPARRVLSTPSQAAAGTTTRAAHPPHTALRWPHGRSRAGHRPRLGVMASWWVLLHRFRCLEGPADASGAATVPTVWQRRAGGRRGWTALLAEPAA